MTTRDEIEAFRQHRLWSKVDEVLGLAEVATGRSVTDRQTLARVIAVGKYVKSFKSIEGYLFLANREAQADNLAAQFDAVESQLSGWDQDASMLPATEAQIDANCDQILNYLYDYKWPTVRKGREDIVASTSESFRSAAEGSIAGIEVDVQRFRDQIADLELQLAELTKESVRRNEEAASALAGISSTEAALAENAQASLQLELKKVNEAAAAQRTKLGNEGDELLKGLRIAHETGNQLVAKVADQSVGGEYLAFAQSEMKAYRIWNGLGIGSVAIAFLFLVVVFGGPLVHLVDKTEGVENVLLKIGISLSLAGFSVYAFREAGKRQRQSLEARYRALDVIALPPFARDLNDSQQKQLRFLMGERLFGSTVESASTKSKATEKNNSFSFSVDPGTVKSVIETVDAIRKATG